MKFISLILFLILLSQSSKSQTIKNSSFDTPIDTSEKSKTNWYYKPNSQSYFQRDSTIAHSGKYSLKFTATDSTKFSTAFYQHININSLQPKKMFIVAWLKTQACSKGAGLLLTQFDKNGSPVSYTSSRQQETLVKGTTEWTKTKLLVLLRPETTSIEIGASLYANGSAWIDDITIEEFKENTNPVSELISSQLDSMIKIVKENALVSDSINWDYFSKELRTLGKGMQNNKQAELLGHYIISELRKYGDSHSFYIGTLDAKAMNSEQINSSTENMTGRYLDNNIAYVNMPTFISLNETNNIAFATNAQSVIADLNSKNSINGWIVDLRNNGGGNCWPMIAGLGPLIGEGIINNTTTQKGDRIIGYYINGESYEEENGKKIEGCKVLNPYTLNAKDIPVAVLIGPNCGSSGEITALAFVGRKNTRLFGKPTAGYTKGNGTFYLPDSSIFFISSIVSTDRNGIKYPERVFPDELIEDDSATSIDLTLERAKKWLIEINKKRND